MNKIAFFILTVGYPPLVYLGYRYFEPGELAGLLAVLAVLRALSSQEKIWRVTAGIALLLALASLLGNHLLPLKLYPALVNLALLAVFAASCLFPPTVVERMARLQHPDLPAEAIPYTRRVTLVWCGFFILNGALALVTALWCSDALWALYNGFIAYILMALLFGAEWLIRRRFMQKPTIVQP